MAPLSIPAGIAPSAVRIKWEREMRLLDQDNNLPKNERRRAAVDRPTRSYMLDMIIMMVPLAVMAVVHYGARALGIMALSVLSAVVFEGVGYALMRRPAELGDFSAVFTGLAIALVMPASVPLWMPVAGVAFAIIAVKLPFGSAPETLFVPAAAGIAFLTVCWGDLLFTYPAVGTDVVVTGSQAFVRGDSLAAMLRVGDSGAPTMFNFFNIVSGGIAGPMGTTCTIALFGAAVYLLIRRPSQIIAPAAFVAVCSVCAVIFSRVLSGRKASLTMEIASGMLVFAALFFMSDPATGPKKPLEKLIYGLAGGSLCMLLRYFGAYEEGACFAVLLMNAAWPPVSRAIFRRKKKAADDKLLAARKNQPSDVPEGGEVLS